MKRAVAGFIVGAVLVGGSQAFAQQVQPPTCEESLQIMQLAYVTKRDTAEVYIESIAREQARVLQEKASLKQVQAKLDDALAKIKVLEDAKVHVEEPK